MINSTRLCLQHEAIMVNRRREQVWESGKTWLLDSNSAIQSILQDFTILVHKPQFVWGKWQCCYKIGLWHREQLVQDLQGETLGPNIQHFDWHMSSLLMCGAIPDVFLLSLSCSCITILILWHSLALNCASLREKGLVVWPRAFRACCDPDLPGKMCSQVQ